MLHGAIRPWAEAQADGTSTTIPVRATAAASALRRRQAMVIGPSPPARA
jgi:hypothetical protein